MALDPAPLICATPAPPCGTEYSCTHAMPPIVKPTIRLRITACNEMCRRLARGLEKAKYGTGEGAVGGGQAGRKRGRSASGAGEGPRVRPGLRGEARLRREAGP